MVAIKKNCVKRSLPFGSLQAVFFTKPRRYLKQQNYG